MVVDGIKKKENILPIGFGILFSLIYYKLPLDNFVVLLLGFIGLISILYDIRIGVMVGVVILPFLDYFLTLIYMAFMVGVYLYKILFKDIRPLREEPIDCPIILFAILILISTITSVTPQGSFRDLALHLTSMGFIFVLVNSINTKKDFNILVTVLVFTATTVSILGLIQYRAGVEMEGGWVDFVTNPDATIRIYSVLGNPNILAEYLVMIIPISIALFWYSKRISKKLLFFLTSLILVIALVFTLSRGGWLGLAFGLLVFTLLIEKRLLLLAIPLALGIVYIVPDRIFNRVVSIGNLEDSSNAYRISVWKIALEMIKDNWLIGVGLGYIPFKTVYETYIGNIPIYHVHNTFLQILTEMGILGLMVFMFFIFTLFKYSIKRLINGEDRYIQVMAGGLLSGLAGLLIHGVAENILFMPKIIITFWTLIGLILALMRISQEGQVD